MRSSFNLPTLLERGQAELVSPEEVKPGDNLVGIIRLSTQIEIHCFFAYLGDSREYFDIIPVLSFGEMKPHIALREALAELEKSFLDKLPLETIVALDSLLKFRVLGERMAQNLGAQAYDDFQLASDLQPLVELPLESYTELYRLEKNVSTQFSNESMHQTTGFGSAENSNPAQVAIEGHVLDSTFYPMDLFGTPPDRMKN